MSNGSWRLRYMPSKRSRLPGSGVLCRSPSSEIWRLQMRSRVLHPDESSACPGHEHSTPVRSSDRHPLPPLIDHLQHLPWTYGQVPPIGSNELESHEPHLHEVSGVEFREVACGPVFLGDDHRSTPDSIQTRFSSPGVDVHAPRSALSPSRSVRPARSENAKIVPESVAPRTPGLRPIPSEPRRTRQASVSRRARSVHRAGESGPGPGSPRCPRSSSRGGFPPGEGAPCGALHPGVARRIRTGRRWCGRAK